MTDARMSNRAMARKMHMPESTFRRKATVASTHPDVSDEGKAILGLPRAGMDGKRYRAHPLTEQERCALLKLVHTYRHLGVSIRGIVEVVGDISVGTVARYLTITSWGDGVLTPREQCPVCSVAPSGAPEREAG
jgi:hypothetical protein